MREEDKRQFAEILKVTYVELYQREPLTRVGLQLWWSLFEQYDIDKFRSAVSGWCAQSQFPPKPADILKLINGSTEDRAVLAWHKAAEAAARVGQYQSVCFDDPLIHAAIDQMGGWSKFCSHEEREMPHVGRMFEKTYRALATGNYQFPAYLPGAHERDNSAAGHRRPTSPILIGDPTRAAAVLDSGCAPGLRITDQSIGQLASLITQQSKGDSNDSSNPSNG